MNLQQLKELYPVALKSWFTDVCDNNLAKLIDSSFDNNSEYLTGYSPSGTVYLWKLDGSETWEQELE